MVYVLGLRKRECMFAFQTISIHLQLFDSIIMWDRRRFIVYNFVRYISSYPNFIILRTGPPGKAMRRVALQWAIEHFGQFWYANDKFWRTFEKEL